MTKPIRQNLSAAALLAFCALLAILFVWTVQHGPSRAALVAGTLVAREATTAAQGG